MQQSGCRLSLLMTTSTIAAFLRNGFLSGMMPTVISTLCPAKAFVEIMMALATGALC
jgi:hypothetical protein